MSLLYTDSAQFTWARMGLAQSLQQEMAPQAAVYRMLQAYYENNGLYDAVQQALYEQAIWSPGMKPLRNPAHRTIEFYASKLWPGPLPAALPILADNDAVITSIQQVHTWSNWASGKQVFARWFSLFGNTFIKVATKTGRVYFQNIRPEYVSDIDVDERGFLIFIRIDIPQSRKLPGGRSENYWHTEVWDKALQSYRVWQNRKGPSQPIEQLGPPLTIQPFSDFGIDFVPVVHAKFQDSGDVYGVGAFVHALDKIDEANRMATRLHQLLYRYNKPTVIVSANAVDKAGRPIPPPKLSGQTDSSDPVDVRDDEIYFMPGMSTFGYLTPDINYQAALAILQDQMSELERDLPELAYYRLREMGSDLSGRAVRLLLSDAIDKILEARGNAEAALIRADEMALTIGQNMGLFKGLGNYEAGDFAHEFSARDIVAPSEMERLETVQAGTSAGVPLATMLRRVGWSEDDLAQMEDDRQAAQKVQQAELAQQMLEARRRFDSAGLQDDEK